jgi:hypothetical protein
MLTENEKQTLKVYKEAATLNKEQIADYFDLLKKEEVKPVEEVKKKKK